MKEDWAQDGDMKGELRGGQGTSARCFDPAAPTRAELDIMREKAAALGRTGRRLDEQVQRMKALEGRITMLEREAEGTSTVNALIREFNQVREQALHYRRCLIIQREAMGFRRHPTVMGLYQIPRKRKNYP
jgi:hypothetical protein